MLSPSPELRSRPPRASALTHFVGDFLAQVSFHQEYPGDLLTGPVQDSGNQRVLRVF